MGVDNWLTNLTDLHQHLGFSSTPHFLWELAHEQGISIKEKDYWKFIKSISINKKTSQKRYHHLFDITQKIQSGPYGVEKSTHQAVSYSYRKANITTLEIRFNPMRRNQSGENDLDKVILAACVGLKKASLEYPVKTGLIIETDRRFDKELNKILINKAIKFKNFGVVGVDLSGPENKNFRVGDLVDDFLKAKKAGLGLTFHTGETSSIDEMEEVIVKIKPQRIGHGVKAAKDKRIINLLVKNNIVLEICPSSNISLNILKDWREASEVLKIFKKTGVLFTINSDAPTLLKTNVKNEFEILIKNKILSIDDILKIKKIAQKASFINLN